MGFATSVIQKLFQQQKALIFISFRLSNCFSTW